MKRGVAFALLLPGASAAAIAASPAPRAAAGAAIVIPGQNCGTHWTGWVKEPNADVNPCPKGCVRGKRLRLDRHKNGDATEYQANYECYLPKLEVPQPALKARASGAPPRRDCGTMWTGWQSDPKSTVNPCPANCERGELRLVNRSLTNGKAVYDMNYRCYFKEPEVASPKTRVINTAKIEITGPSTKVIRTAAIQITGPATKVIRTAAIQITGPSTKVIRTAAIQITGPATRVIRTMQIEITGAH